MYFIPSFRKITTADSISEFTTHYHQCSGFNVPRDYYENNQVFAIFWKNQMAGGFVLGKGETLRTLEVFAGDKSRAELYQHIRAAEPHTEMCCFWMHPSFHRKTWLNFFVWCCVAFALQFYGTKRLIFGTCSARLAALYDAAPKAQLLHTDYLNKKQTFIFTGPRRDCLMGVVHIMWYKMKRLGKLHGGKKQQRFDVVRVA